MNTDEGYIKFKPVWQKKPPLPQQNLVNLLRWRKKLFQLGLIGAYQNGVGYGNLSERYGTVDKFVISGSATGHFPALTPAHFSVVTEVDLEHNTLRCEGPAIASSESMSHAAIYRCSGNTVGVMHVHHKTLWKKLLHKVPTTDRSVPYGTPEMALAIMKLFTATELPEVKILAMEGHEEGIFTFGRDLDEAGDILLDYFSAISSLRGE